jgi:hypothetical protein
MNTAVAPTIGFGSSVASTLTTEGAGVWSNNDRTYTVTHRR